MSEDPPYAVAFQANILDDVRLGGCVTEDVALAALKFIGTELAGDPWMGKLLVGPKYDGKNLLSVTRDEFKVIYRPDHVLRQVIIHAIGKGSR